jgi:site-specific DNA recombinase
VKVRRRKARRSSNFVKYEGEENALVYIRVSSKEQAIKALNLENQEGTCREDCQRQGWPVIARFLDKHSARNAVDRPEFQRMLAYCRANPGKIRYVVVFDLSRFARNVADQGVAIAELARCGVELYSVREPNIDATPAGKLAANMFGAMNQYHSDALSANMKVKMRQSAEKGRWPGLVSLGYKNIGGNSGPNIIPDVDRAPHIKRAFELIRTDRFKQSDTLEILNREGFTTAKGKPVTMQTFQKILRNPIYAGWITRPSDETFEPVRGLHEPLISQELFDQVQLILDGRTPPPTPKRKVNPDFPLKCFVRCESCGNPLTGGSNKGKTKWYRRYWCYRPECRAVKILADELEDQFVDLLGRLRPAPGDDSKLRQKAVKRWTDRKGDVEKETVRLEANLQELKMYRRELLKSKLKKEISDATYQEAETEYSYGIISAEQELRSLRSRSVNQEAFLRFVDEFRSVDMAAAWKLAGPESKRRVQTFLFSGGLTYSDETRNLNPPNSSLFICLEVLYGPESSLASPTGFEPVLSP